MENNPENNLSSAQPVQPAPPPPSVPPAAPSLETSHPFPLPKARSEKPPFWRSKWIVLLILLLVVLIPTGVFALGKIQSKTAPIPMPNPVEVATPTSDPTTNWKTYTIKEIGVSFKLPQELDNNESLKQYNVGGQTGSQICMINELAQGFRIVPIAYAGSNCTSSTATFQLQANSTDYTQGRDGRFTDYEGFVNQNGIYSLRFVSNQISNVPQEHVHYLLNNTGVEILKVDGVDANPSESQGGREVWSPGAEWYGAVVNTKNNTYPGISFEIMKSAISNEEFDLILQSFKFTNSQTSMQSYLSIPEFGVKIPLSSAIKDAYYLPTIKTGDNISWVYLRVHSLDSEPHCNDNTSLGVAALNRVGKDDIDQRTGNKYSDSGTGSLIGDYYYYIDLEQAVCSQNPSNEPIETSARKTFGEVAKTITAM